MDLMQVVHILYPYKLKARAKRSIKKKKRKIHKYSIISTDENFFVAKMEETRAWLAPAEKVKVEQFPFARVA